MDYVVRVQMFGVLGQEALFQGPMVQTDCSDKEEVFSRNSQRKKSGMMADMTQGLTVLR